MPSYEFYEIFKNTLFTQHLRTAASGCTAIRVGVVVVVAGGGLSGAKPDPDFARSVIAHHCFLKHFNSPEVMKFLFVSLLNTITNSSGQFTLDETSTESKVSTVFF